MAAVVLLAVACGGDGGVPSATPTGPVVSATPGVALPQPPARAPATPSVSSATPFLDRGRMFSRPAGGVGPIVWSRSLDSASKAPIDPVSAFSPDAATLYAAVPIAFLQPGAQLTASWTYNNTPLDPFTRTVVADGQSRDYWVEFHLSRAADVPWPSGTYAIEVRLNGEVAQSSRIAVAGGG